MASAVEHARAIFEQVDTSHDGSIDRNELGKLLEALGEEATPQNIVSVLFQMDTNEDGTISFDEFVTFYKSNYLPRHPTKLLTSRHNHADIGMSKHPSYTLPPPKFCFGKALQRDKENAGQVLRQHGDASDESVCRTRQSVCKFNPDKVKSNQRPLTATTSSKIRQSSTLSQKNTEPREAAVVAMETSEAGVAFVLRQLQDQLRERGVESFQSITQFIQNSTSTSMSFVQFRELIQERLELNATEKDLRALFSVFDQNQNNSIEASEWAAALLTPLTGTRLDIVNQAFRSIDTRQTGVVDFGQLRLKYHAESHPDVRTGLKTPDEVRSEFLAAICNGTSGAIHREHFHTYYTHVSSATANDDNFTRLVTLTWQLDQPNTSGNRLGTANPPPAPAVNKYCRVRAPWLTTDTASSLLYEARGGVGEEPSNAAQAARQNKELDAGIRGILHRIQSQLEMIGVSGWISLDQATSSTLNLQSFKDVMKNAGIVLSDKDWRVLFERFSVKHSTLELQALLKHISTPLKPERLGIIRRTFRSLDEYKRGQVVDLLDRFDATQHPWVKNERCTQEEVVDMLKLALGTSQVSAEAFEKYYGYVSQGIDDDAEFEQHVLDVWHNRFHSAVIDKIDPTPPQEIEEKKDPLEMYQESIRHLNNQNHDKKTKRAPGTTSSSRQATHVSKSKTSKSSRPATSTTRPPTSATMKSIPISQGTKTSSRMKTLRS